MVSRWAFDQFSNTVWTLQWRCLTGWRLTMLCAHQRPYTRCAHRHFLHQKTSALLGIEPVAPLPSQSPSLDVNPQCTTVLNSTHCSDEDMGIQLCIMSLTTLPLLSRYRQVVPADPNKQRWRSTRGGACGDVCGTLLWGTAYLVTLCQWPVLPFQMLGLHTLLWQQQMKFDMSSQFQTVLPWQ